MTKEEYLSVNDYSYWHYMKHLEKDDHHGLVPYNYFTPELSAMGREYGLFAHHKPAYYRAGLSSGNFVINPRYGKYQDAKNLVWCDWLEHLYAHILILEDPEAENKDRKSVVLNLIPDLYVFFELGMHPYNRSDVYQSYYDRIADDYEVFKLLVERYFGQYSIRQLNDAVRNKIAFEGNNTRMPKFALIAWARSEDEVIINNWNNGQNVNMIFNMLHEMNDKPSAQPKRSIQNIIDRARYLGL